MFVLSQADEGADTDTDTFHPFCVISLMSLIVTRGQRGIFTPIIKGSSRFLPYCQPDQNLVPGGF